MKGFEPKLSFGPHAARTYDDYPRGDEEVAAEFLSGFAKAGRALEFAIGTGRIALPLAARGVQVDGIELSPHMITQLRAKTGGQLVDVVIGDMSSTTMNRLYDLVYIVYNSIFNLLTVDGQIRCFENAARHLNSAGHFVVETAVPHAWISPGQPDYVHTEHVGLDVVVLDVARYDPVTQLLEENHVRLTPNGITMAPIVCRLITPGEMDLMARMAGLHLVARYATWQRTEFNAHSTAHISIYGFGSERQA
jgi:SAM-dependent methyltransferase